MSSSREDSPDWLRTFQAPTGSPLTLSSTSGSEDDDASRGASPSSDYRFGSQSLARGGVKDEEEEDDDVVVVGVDGGEESKKIPQVKGAKRGRSVDGAAPSKGKKKKKKKTTEDGGDGNTQGENTSEKHTEGIHSIWDLSSDSEYCPLDDEISPKRKKREHHVVESDDDGLVFARINMKSPSKKAGTKKSPRKHLEAEQLTAEKETIIGVVQGKASDDIEVPKDTSEKHIGSRISTSRLPLVLSEKVHRSKALVECEGDSIDLSGDMGAVGRIVVSDTSSGDNEMYFDLKGTIYKTKIVPSRTFCIVSFGQSEAKIEAIMNDFIQLKPQSNVYEAETMVEGTLEGFSFESDDEADKMQKAASHQNDQDEPQEDKANGKSKGKARKPSGVALKKAKTGGAKSQPARKGRKKAPVSKKSKAKK